MSEEFSNDISDNLSETSSLAESVLQEPATSEYDAPPQSWKKDVADRHWRTLDPDLRGYLHTRETESHGRITQQGQRLKELEGLSSRYQPIEDVFGRYQTVIPEGLERGAAIEQLLAAHQALSTPETSLQAFSQLAQMCGVDPMALLPQQVREQFQTAQQELQKVREAEVQKAVDEFTKDKTYYAEIREDVIKEIVEIRKGAPGLDNATVLRLAHDRVIDRTGIKARLDAQAKAEAEGRTIEAQAARLKEMQEQEEKRKAEEAARVKAAKRAAGINVRSSSATGRAPRSMDDELRAIATRIYGT